MQNQVKYEIQKLGKKAHSQLNKTDKVIASSELIAEKVSEVGHALTSGFYTIGEGLRELCFNIDAGFREVDYKLDLLGHQLDSIREILEKPLDTQARELRRRGEFAYLNNWIEEAENDLLEAEKKNYQDFLVHLMLGNIFFYHKNDLKKALDYYQKAAKYAAPQSKKHASYALVCAAIVYYKEGQVPDAYHSTKLALELLPQDWNAVYHHARYCAKMNYIEEFKQHLTKCIVNDPNYLLTADNDVELNNVKDEIIKIAEDLRDDKSRIVNNLIDKLMNIKKKAEELRVADFEPINEAIKNITNLFKRNSYLDLLIAANLAIKTKKLAINIVDDNYKKLIAEKRKYIGELYNEKDKLLYYKIEMWGCMCFIFGFIIFIVMISLRTATINWVIHPSLIIIIGIAMVILLYKMLPKLIKKNKIVKIENKIFQEKGTLKKIENFRNGIISEISR
ncbi:MAG: hypothetical protein COS90_04560 [Deltaproteobacteria bacterium CG07_land_8_20_14_0_80_60_11]|nr:MAG: hypothetical protein COS90_04560 [Deltaproteobacteria bacterium CG07_land_8_20_14_0_80_60_11]